MFKIRKNTILLLLYLIPVSILGNVNFSGTPFIKNYPRSTYMAGSQTWDIEQGINGMMYFANNDGLLEFNGVHWNVYPLPNFSVLRSLAVGLNGLLYGGGFNELGYYKLGDAGGAYYTSLVDLLPYEYRNFGDVWKIYNYMEGVVFQTPYQLMYYKNNEIEVVQAPSLFHFSFVVNNEFYVNDMEFGLHRYAMGELYPLKGTESLIGKEIWGILPVNNRLIIATSSDGLFMYNGNSLSPLNNSISEYLKENQIYSSYLLDNDNVVYGTIQNGVLISDKDGNFVDQFNMSDGLQNNTILCIGKDYLGNLWLGTDHGIDYVEINSPLSKISNNFGLSSGYSMIIEGDRVYLGTNQGLFTKKLSSSEESIYDRKTMFSIVEANGQVWSLSKILGTIFCGHHNGVYIVNESSVTKVSDVQGAWKFLPVPNSENLVICGTYTGLMLIEKTEDGWKVIKQYEGFSESTRKMEFDSDGSLWISHGYQGVYNLVFDPEYESIEKIDFYNTINSNLPNQVTDVVKLDNQILFLTTIGVMEYKDELSDFFINEKFGKLFGNKSVQLIKEDVDRNLWYFSEESSGVLRYSEDGSYIDISLPFSEIDDSFIYSFEFVYPYNENNVYFGNENGFVHYKPKYAKNYTYDFSTYLLGMLAGYDDSLYSYSKAKENEIVINFENNSAEFLFSANDFANPDKVLYSTFLEGNDDHWSEWQSRNIRTYTNLYEGDYTFRVKSKNIYGTISDEKSISFRVLPPFFRSIGAYMVYVGFFILLIFIVILSIRKRLKRIKYRDQKIQQDLFLKKEEQLRLETLESEKEVIRMRNEKLREDVKNKDKELANSTMQMLQKNKMLITLRDELKKIAGLNSTESHNYDINRLVRGINKEIDNETQWQVFETHFESVHEEFLTRIKNTYPKLTPKELKLCAYLRMNISSKEIAVLMNISIRGVEISRYRLRKKLALSRDTNLTDFILSF